MNLEQYRAMIAEQMSENDLLNKVIDTALRYGWMYYHTYNSRRSVPGFLDLVLVHADRGVLWRELKKQNGRVSPDQRKWMDRLTAAGENVGVWRPSDWVSDRIVKELMG